MTRLLKTANEYPAEVMNRIRDNIAAGQRSLEQLQREAEKPFEQAADFEATQKRLWEVEAELEAMNKTEEEMLLRSLSENDGQTITGEAMDEAARFD